MEGSGVGPVAEAEEVPPAVGAGAGVLAGVGELVDGTELGELGELGVLGVLDVPTRVGGPARRLGAAGVPLRRPTSCFNIVAATSRQTDLTMKASNAHTRARVVSGCARMDYLSKSTKLDRNCPLNQNAAKLD